MERMMEQERKQVMPWKVKELKRDQNGIEKKKREKEIDANPDKEEKLEVGKQK